MKLLSPFRMPIRLRKAREPRVLNPAGHRLSATLNFLNLFAGERSA
jgi:hypothetical protein